MFFHFWWLGRCSCSVSLPFCLLTGRPFAGYVSFCTFGCSVGTHLAFPCLFIGCTFVGCAYLCAWLLGRLSFIVSVPFCLLIGRTFAGCARFCAFGCSVGTPLAFLCHFASFLAALLPVVYVFAHLVAW